VQLHKPKPSSQIQSEIVPIAALLDKDLDYKSRTYNLDLNIPWGNGFLPDGSIIFN
jgi:hypothetical protein